MKKRPLIHFGNGLVLVPLAGGKGHAVIDECDAELVGQYNWYLHSRGYAATFIRAEGQPQVLMHRLLMGVTGLPSTVVDHRNGNKLLNIRANLRTGRQAENVRNSALRTNNSSGLKGVSWDRGRGKWVAKIQVDGRTLNLGRFDTAEQAHAAYCEASKTYHKEFGRTA